ncbi:MAG: hypothetical protein JWQ62_1308 [Lacunisphaera sp.]|nr:hypothetical protein [Lacunisphaera sp.]
MKTIFVSGVVFLVASVMSAQTTPAPAPAKPADTTVTPAAPAPATPAPAKPAAKKDEKKKEEEPKIPGVTIKRPDGNLLGLEVVAGNFKLSFYDKKKKPMPVDVTRATARWPNPRAPGDNRTVLNVNGSALVGQKPVVPPYNFNVFLTLLRGEGDGAQAVESYVVPMGG